MGACRKAPADMDVSSLSLLSKLLFFYVFGTFNALILLFLAVHLCFVMYLTIGHPLSLCLSESNLNNMLLAREYVAVQPHTILSPEQSVYIRRDEVSHQSAEPYIYDSWSYTKRLTLDYIETWGAFCGSTGTVRDVNKHEATWHPLA